MHVTVKVYSKAYMEEEDSSWSARPSRELLSMIHRSGESARWICKLGETKWIALGDPVAFSVTESPSLFVPQWMLEGLEGSSDGDEMEIECIECETLPKATRLSCKIVGTLPRDMDIRDILETPLSQLGVLEQGQFLPVPAFEDLVMYVDEVEPVGGYVFLDGAEIAFEVEEDREKPVEAAVPAPQRQEEEQEEEDYTDMIPRIEPIAKGYLPFQGKGNRLGSA